MAKSKRTDKKKKRGNGSDKPQPKGKDQAPLRKDIPEIKKEVVKVDKHKREILHELWPNVLLHHISSAESAIWRSYGAYAAGLTPGEVEELKKIREDLKRDLDRLNLIYFRLKFWQ